MTRCRLSADAQEPGSRALLAGSSGSGGERGGQGSRAAGEREDRLVLVQLRAQLHDLLLPSADHLSQPLHLLLQVFLAVAVAGLHGCSQVALLALPERRLMSRGLVLAATTATLLAAAAQRR